MIAGSKVKIVLNFLDLWHQRKLQRVKTLMFGSILSLIMNLLVATTYYYDTDKRKCMILSAIALRDGYGLETKKCKILNVRTIFKWHLCATPLINRIPLEAMTCNRADQASRLIILVR